MNAVLRSGRVVFSSKLTYGQQFICKKRAPSLYGLLKPRGGRHTVQSLFYVFPLAEDTKTLT